MPTKPNRKAGRNVQSAKNLAFTRAVQSQSRDKIEENNSLPLELQQVILNVFKVAFPVLDTQATLQENIQKVKGHLFNRDFATAFGPQENLEAYAVRWSAARSLAYTAIFSEKCREGAVFGAPCASGSAVTQVSEINQQTVDLGTSPASSAETRIVCIGGGAGAEIVSLAATHKLLNIRGKTFITAIDIADWSMPVSRLGEALFEPPKLSAHASEAAKVRPQNQPLLRQSSLVNVSFQQQDVLTWDAVAMKVTLKDANLCTMMFTLNELFTSSLQKTTSFLLNLTGLMVPGSHLLIVDSPGSYSEIQLQNPNADQTDGRNAEAPKKRYPMKWLLDHTLLTVAKIGDEAAWIKLEDEDSLWFRIDAKDREKLQYPLELENMRYQLHLYRRL